jgi:hypothetical protein
MATSFDDPRFKKPASEWTLEDLDAWAALEYQQRVASGEIAREEAEAQAFSEQQERETKERYEGWKRELAWLLKNDDGDENTAHRIQCLKADIFGYEAARAAIERGDEDMPENPYEAGLRHPL